MRDIDQRVARVMGWRRYLVDPILGKSYEALLPSRDDAKGSVIINELPWNGGLDDRYIDLADGPHIDEDIPHFSTVPADTERLWAWVAEHEDVVDVTTGWERDPPHNDDGLNCWAEITRRAPLRITRDWSATRALALCEATVAAFEKEGDA